MKRVYIMRHAEAQAASATRSDFDRPLTARGAATVPKAALAMRDVLQHVDRIVTSPAKRTLMTANLLADALCIPPDRIVTDASIYAASGDDLIEIIRAWDNKLTNVILVGHNPAVTLAVNYLVGDILTGMATCDIYAVQLNVNDWSAVNMAAGTVICASGSER